MKLQKLQNSCFFAALFLMWTVVVRAQAPVITVSPNFGTWPVGEVQYALTATGGNGAFTWKLESGPLPLGLSIRTDVPSFFPAGTAAGLIGVATTPGTYSFTISVTSAGNTVFQVCTMKITGFTLKDTYNLPDGFTGTPFTYTLTALNSAGLVTFTPTGGVPPGMTLSPAGVLSGTPSAAGSYNISFSMSDGIDTIYRGVGIKVSAVQITNPGLLPNATGGSAYNVVLTGAGGAGPYTFTAGGLPAGLSLNSATGLISGTVTGGRGESHVSVTVSDHNNVSYTKFMAIDVLYPTVTAGYVQPNGNFDDCTIGIGCSRGISVRSGGTAPFIYSVAGLPPGMDFRTGSGVTSPGIWPGDVELWGTPTATGTYNVRITVTDANSLTTSETFPLKVGVLEIYYADMLPSGTRGTVYSKTLRVIGGTGPYTVTQLPNSRMPAGLSLAGVVVSGTPIENGSFNGEFSYSDSASHALQMTEYFSIDPTANVNINNGPSLGNILLNAFYSNQLTACCLSPYTWGVTAGLLPPGMSLSTGGLLSGFPTASGTYSFTVQATDQANAGSYGIRVFTLVVTPLNFSPCCTLAFGNIGAPYNQTLTITGATGSITYTLVPGNYLPPGLLLNSSTGQLNGTPSEVGQFQFAVLVTDSGGHSLTRTFNVYIFPSGGSPPVSMTVGPNLGTWTIGEVQYALTATGGSGVYSWAFVGGTLPPGVALRTDVPSSFPAGTGAGLIGLAATPGNYTFTLSVSSGGNTITQGFTFRITAATLKDTALPNGFIGASYGYEFTPLNAAGPLSWSITTALPPGLTFTTLPNGNGFIGGTPAQPGTWNVRVQFTDGIDTVSRGLSMVVSAVRFVTPGSLPNVKQNAPYTTTVIAAGGTGSFTYTTPGGLPGGLSLSSNGTISGTVSSGPGRRGFQITATDTNGVSYTKEFSIDVIGVPPALPSISLVNLVYKAASIGVGYSRLVNVLNGGTAPFTWTAIGLPPGLSFRDYSASRRTDLIPGDAELWGVPTALGTFNVQLTVTDANGVSATIAFPFTVSALVVDGSDMLPDGTVGIGYSKALRVLGGTAPYSVTQLDNFGHPLPAGLGLNPGAFTVSGVPQENGTFDPILQFHDSGSNAFDALNHFTISNGSSTVVVNQSFNLGTITANQAYSLQLSACCTASGLFNWSQISGTVPAGITLSGTGRLSGTPTAPGSYTFQVQAADANNASNVGLRQFQLIVTPLSYTSSSGLGYGNVGTPFSKNLLSSVTGAIGSVTAALEFGSFLPPGLTLTNGSLSGTPTASGNFSFTVSFTDSAGNLLIRTFSVQIYALGASPALQFLPVVPCRIIDTRGAVGPLGGPFIPGGGTRNIPVPSSPCGIPSNAVAYSLNVTVVPRAGTLGYVTVWPTGQTQPAVSTLNAPDGSVLANAAIVPAGSGGSISAFALQNTDLVIDINGYFVPPTTGTLQFYPLTPCRVLDTRFGTGPLAGPALSAGAGRSFPIASSSCGVPPSAAAYSFNVTAVPHGMLGYLTAWPTGQPQPNASTLNSLDGTVLANAAIVPAGTNGAVSFYAMNDTGLVVDINGYFAPPATGGLNFFTVVPCRIVDTRSANGLLGGPILAGNTFRTFPLSTSPCGLPADSAAYSLNMTVQPVGPLGYLTTWPAGVAQPVVSTLNADKGLVVANAALVPAGLNAAVSVYVLQSTHVIIDTNGYFK